MADPNDSAQFDDLFGDAEHPDAGMFDDLLKDTAEGQPAPPGTPVPTPRPPQASYGPGSAFVDSLNLGYGPQLGESAWRLRGASPRTAHDHALEIEAARQNYALAHPGQKLAMDLLGGIAPAAATLEAGGAGFARLAPEAAAALEALRGGSFAGRAAARAATGAAGGAAIGALPNGESDAGLGARTSAGALTGLLGNPALGVLGDAAASKIAPLTAKSAQALRNLGVNLNVGDVPGASPLLHMLNSLYGDGGASGRATLSQAAARTMGAEGKPLTSGTMKATSAKLSDQFAHFADLANDAELHDAPLRSKVFSAMQDASGPGAGISEEGFQKLQSAAKTVLGTAEAPATINGKTYLQLTRSGGPLDRLTRDPEVGQHAAQIWDALNDSLERQVGSGMGKWVPQSGGTPQGSAPAGELYSQLGASPAPPQLGVGLPSEGLRWAQKRDLGGRFAGGQAPYKPNFTNREENLPSLDVRPNFQFNGHDESQVHEGTLENGTPHPEEPGLEWQYNPGAKGLVDLLRTTRAQWRNMKILEPLADDTTGEISNPKSLAARAARAFGNSPKSNLHPLNLDLKSLGESDNFIPKDSGSPPSFGAALASKLKPLTGAYGLPLALGAYEYGAPAMHALQEDPKKLLYGALLGALGYGAGKGAHALGNGAWNSNRILSRAAAGGATELPWAKLAAGPAVHLTEPEPAPKKKETSE